MVDKGFLADATTIIIFINLLTTDTVDETLEEYFLKFCERFWVPQCVGLVSYFLGVNISVKVFWVIFHIDMSLAGVGQCNRDPTN